MTEPKTFAEYYKYYLTLHQNPWNRRLHVLGQFATIFYVVFWIYLLTISWWFLPLALFTPFVVYFFAWTGHYVFEKNQPAAFKNPVWAKICDWIMLWEILTGKIPL